ncbi:MAG TPA: DUF3987 domain-containing protein, partial [Bacteroidia bacterium]
FIQEGLYTMYPNQYIVLVAPPGIGKGTAINFVWKINRENSPNLLANMISDRVTGPRILERIATGWNAAPQMVGGQIVQGSTDHSCTIFSTELSVLLGASDQMLDFLCECWDKNEYDYDTKNSGSAFIKDMSVSLIGATVPDFIRNIDRNKNMSIKGGFTSRCLFIYEEQPSRFILHPPPISTNQKSVKLLADLKNDLDHISNLPGGEYKYSPAAAIHFDRFISSIRTNVNNDSEAVAHFKSRVVAHVLKLAMILAVSSHDDLIINDFDMYNAIECVKTALGTLEKVFRGSGDSNMAAATGYVQAHLEKTGGSSRNAILKALYRHMDPDCLDRILYVLTEIGFCKTSTPAKGGSVLYIPLNGTAASKNGAGGKRP